MKSLRFHIMSLFLSMAAICSGQAVDGPCHMPNGNVEYFEEESAMIWRISLSTDNTSRKKKKPLELSRPISITTHRFDHEGHETEHCVFRPRNATLATIELDDNGNPVLVNDSIDMTVPTERVLYEYRQNGTLIAFHYESHLGTEQLTGIDTLACLPEPVPEKKYVQNDSLSTTTYYLNDYGFVSTIETDHHDGTMSVTTYEGYRYDVYGNWTERKRYSLLPDGRHLLTGTDKRSYRYR